MYNLQKNRKNRKNGQINRKWLIWKTSNKLGTAQNTTTRIYMDRAPQDSLNQP